MTEQEKKDRRAFKELQGRYATRMQFPKRKYDFTDILCRYDALTTGKTTCVEEYKVYNNPKHPRYHNRDGKNNEVKDYMIDYSKCDAVCERAKNDEEGEREPLVLSYFTDKLLVWNLNKTDWKHNTTRKDVNGDGIDYGTKRERHRLLSLLLLSDAIYTRDIPEGLWDRVNAEIERDYPDLYKRIQSYENEQ